MQSLDADKGFHRFVRSTNDLTRRLREKRARLEAGQEEAKLAETLMNDDRIGTYARVAPGRFARVEDLAEVAALSPHDKLEQTRRNQRDYESTIERRRRIMDLARSGKRRLVQGGLTREGATAVQLFPRLPERALTDHIASFLPDSDDYYIPQPVVEAEGKFDYVRFTVPELRGIQVKTGSGRTITLSGSASISHTAVRPPFDRPQHDFTVALGVKNGNMILPSNDWKVVTNNMPLIDYILAVGMKEGASEEARKLRRFIQILKEVNSTNPSL